MKGEGYAMQTKSQVLSTIDSSTSLSSPCDLSMNSWDKIVFSDAYFERKLPDFAPLRHRYLIC